MALPSIVIIGAGIGGLVAGNLLAKKGYDVTILEQHTTPGGYTAGFTRRGFYFESGTLSFEMVPSVRAVMSCIGVDGKVEFVRQKERWVSEDFDFVAESYRDFKDMLCQTYASRHGRLPEYLRHSDSFYEAASLAASVPFPFSSDGRDFFEAMDVYLSRQKKFIELSVLHPRTTAEEFTSEFFDPRSRLFTLLTKHHGYPGMGIDSLAGCLTLFEDYWTVKDGMQAWADALAQAFAENGGRLHLKSRASRIVTDGNRSTGVELDSTMLKADWVISAIDYKSTFLKLLGNRYPLNGRVRERIVNAEVSESFFTVYLGLAMTNEELRRHMRTHYVVSLEDEHVPEKEDASDEDFFGRAVVSLYSPSLLCADNAPPGKSSLMVFAMAPKRWMEGWAHGEPGRYGYLKARATSQLLKRAERIIPGLLGSIEFRDAATPLTYERYTSNSDGATCAWSWNPKSRFHPRSTGIFIDTPIPNLLMGSAWAMQRGGVPGAILAAYMCSRRIR